VAACLIEENDALEMRLSLGGPVIAMASANAKLLEVFLNNPLPALIVISHFR
jgi:hypothetical protein